MKIVSLIENTRVEDRPDLVAEHGLSLYIQREGGDLLFDTGATGAFADNAQRLGVDLGAVEAAVVSHHHYDHGGGLARFIALNSHAPIYLQKSEDTERAFRLLGLPIRSIGLDIDLLGRHPDRFQYLEGRTEILPGAHLLTHIPQPHPQPRGNRHLYVRRGGRFQLDDFQHELILVLEDGEALVVFTGCSHNGILNMIEAVTDQFPGRPVRALLGGFHLVGLPILNTMAGSKAEVRRLGEALLRYPIGRIYTGHCTGLKAYQILKEVMGDRLETFPTGRELSL